MNRKRMAIVALLPLIIGVAGLTNLLNKPQFSSIPPVAVVQLTGSGACFGVALVALIAMFRGKSAV